MVSANVGKEGWRVIGSAVESGWGQTLRLVLVILALGLGAVSALLFLLVAGGWLLDLSYAGLARFGWT